MTLKHDAAGFLIGDPLDLGRAVSLLETIRSDVRSMRQVVAGSAVATPRVTAKADRAPAAVVPNRGHSSAAKAETVSAVNRQMAAMVKASRPAASPNGRDGRGRFVGNGAGSPSVASKFGNESHSSDGFARRIAYAVTEGLSNTEEADPTVKAFKEVSEPMKRGFKTIFGDRNEKQKTGWFRRIWGELKGIRTEQTTYEKAAAKTLKAIEAKPTAAGEEGGPWFSAILSLGSRLVPFLVPIAAGIASVAAGIAILVSWFTGKSMPTDNDVVDGIQENIADPLKHGLKKIGIDKDAEIESIRTKNRREQNGSDEYERMDRARAAVEAAGINKSSPEYQDRLSRTYQEIERQDAEAGKGRLAKAWDGIKSFGSKKKDRAFATGAAYSQGNIDGLDDANTRALIASTAETESGGGQLNITNKQGYMGRYQAGAAWLADAGLIRGGSVAVKDAIKSGGHKSEWAWAQSGGMSKFLDNPKNWVNGMSKEQYLASADTQDSAFKVNSDRAYAELVKRGAINPGDSQEKIAGLLKARHIAGLGGALSVANGGSGPADANGTTARKYFNDIAANGYANAYQAVNMKLPQVATGSMPTVPSMPAAPIIPSAPEIQIPLSSSDQGRGITVTVPPKDPGQDLENRRLAHIVTGGYSNA